MSKQMPDRTQTLLVEGEDMERLVGAAAGLAHGISDPDSRAFWRRINEAARSALSQPEHQGDESAAVIEKRERLEDIADHIEAELSLTDDDASFLRNLASQEHRGEELEGVPGLKQARDVFDVVYFGHGKSWQDALSYALAVAEPAILAAQPPAPTEDQERLADQRDACEDELAALQAQFEQLKAWREGLWDEVHSVDGPQKRRLVTLGKDLDAALRDPQGDQERWEDNEAPDAFVECDACKDEYEEDYEDEGVECDGCGLVIEGPTPGDWYLTTPRPDDGLPEAFCPKCADEKVQPEGGDEEDWPERRFEIQQDGWAVGGDPGPLYRAIQISGPPLTEQREFGEDEEGPRIVVVPATSQDSSGPTIKDVEALFEETRREANREEGRAERAETALEELAKECDRRSSIRYKQEQFGVYEGYRLAGNLAREKAAKLKEGGS